MTTSYPIAETFHSIQGEGQWTGTPMFFVRLAGCNVGRYSGDLPYAICTTFNGTQFTCDTDYTKTTSLTAQDIVQKSGNYDRICLTGGEPLLHDLFTLIRECREAKKIVHLETSGTLPIPDNVRLNCWVACSPKMGFLAENRARIDEWKFLVDERTRIEDIRTMVNGSRARVFIQPINPVHTVDDSNMIIAREIVNSEPTWRLSTQQHKLIGIR